MKGKRFLPADLQFVTKTSNWKCQVIVIAACRYLKVQRSECCVYGSTMELRELLRKSKPTESAQLQVTLHAYGLGNK